MWLMQLVTSNCFAGYVVSMIPFSTHNVLLKLARAIHVPLDLLTPQ